jgi:methylaspartate mutase sigma subunit
MKNNGDSAEIIIAVTESDAHVVGNRILELALVREGFRVVNLGVCTPAIEIAEAYRSKRNVLAIAIGSINGHGAADLRTFGMIKRDYQLSCPVFFGGYLEVGRRARSEDYSPEELETLGLDDVLDDIPQLITKLKALRQEWKRLRHG